MININYRSVNGYQTFDGNLILSSITNSILSTDSTGLIYGVTSNPSNFLKDNRSGSYTFSQITSDDVQFKLNSNIQGAAAKLGQKSVFIFKVVY